MMFACGKYCVKYKYYETVSSEQSVTIKLWTFMEDLKIQKWMCYTYMYNT